VTNGIGTFSVCLVWLGLVWFVCFVVVVAVCVFFNLKNIFFFFFCQR
jgi:hypothetical protein